MILETWISKTKRKVRKLWIRYLLHSRQLRIMKKTDFCTVLQVNLFLNCLKAGCSFREVGTGKHECRRSKRAHVSQAVRKEMNLKRNDFSSTPSFSLASRTNLPLFENHYLRIIFLFLFNSTSLLLTKAKISIFK